jgi:hypothetical protein
MFNAGAKVIFSSGSTKLFIKKLKIPNYFYAVDLYAVAGVAAVIAHTDAREVPSAVGFHGAAVDGDGLAAAVAAAADARTVGAAITHYQCVADSDVATLAVVAGADARAMLVTPSICISKFFPASYPYTNTL